MKRVSISNDVKIILIIIIWQHFQETTHNWSSICRSFNISFYITCTFKFQFPTKKKEKKMKNRTTESIAEITKEQRTVLCDTLFPWPRFRWTNWCSSKPDERNSDLKWHRFYAGPGVASGEFYWPQERRKFANTSPGMNLAKRVRSLTSVPNVTAYLFSSIAAAKSSSLREHGRSQHYLKNDVATSFNHRVESSILNKKKKKKRKKTRLWFFLLTSSILTIWVTIVIHLRTFTM